MNSLWLNRGLRAYLSGAPMETGGPGSNNMKPQSLQLVLEKQVLALQQQMAENQAISWRKLKSSQEAQQRQAALVRKLQAKVRQLPFQGGGENTSEHWVLRWNKGYRRQDSLSHDAHDFTRDIHPVPLKKHFF